MSYFNERGVDELYAAITDAYLANDYPWVVGFSGGKDSTATLQAVWFAIAGLEPEQRKKPIYVIASDTGVENPRIAERLHGDLRAMHEMASATGMPITAELVRPNLQDSFWVQLIGKGYAAPSGRFRWCTDRLKIRPANDFVRRKVSEHGQVVMVLGSRRAESATRAQVMAMHEIQGSRFKSHSTLRGALVYTPIEGLTTDDVWLYLMNVKNPWSGSNRDLAAMYRSASDAGECPLVVDTKTPSCGNTRFGCWVCTVVQRDRSLAAMIDNGDGWLEPLFDMQHHLKNTQDPEHKLDYRDPRVQRGRMTVKDDGTPVPGRYKMEFCQDMLHRLLRAQEDVQAGMPGFHLITGEELGGIARIWISDRGQPADEVERIHRQATGREIVLDVGDVRPKPGYLPLAPELAVVAASKRRH